MSVMPPIKKSPSYSIGSQGSKYKNKKVSIDGLTFDSKREARRWGELTLLQRVGDIADLELQPRFPLVINGQKIATYIADFRYRRTHTGEVVVEDVKGVRTPVYRLKKKMVLALHGVDIVEID